MHFTRSEQGQARPHPTMRGDSAPAFRCWPAPCHLSLNTPQQVPPGPPSTTHALATFIPVPPLPLAEPEQGLGGLSSTSPHLLTAPQPPGWLWGSPQAFRNPHIPSSGWLLPRGSDCWSNPRVTLRRPSLSPGHLAPAPQLDPGGGRQGPGVDTAYHDRPDRPPGSWLRPGVRCPHFLCRLPLPGAGRPRPPVLLVLVPL